MSTLKAVPGTGLLIVAALLAARTEELRQARLAGALAALSADYGPAVAVMPVIPFDFTPYYTAEMGPGLVKTLLCFERPFPRDGLVLAKRRCCAIEETWRDPDGEKGRTVNLDPGLLTLENFVLATGKNRAHRIYLGQGVYAELTLLYRHGGRYDALPWTYADYKDPRVQGFLKSQRARLA